LDLEYILENDAENIAQKGYIPVFTGDPNYWNVLDNSF